jgi:hypothetical protein
LESWIGADARQKGHRQLRAQRIIAALTSLGMHPKKSGGVGRDDTAG